MNEYIVDIWVNSYNSDYCQWSGWHFSSLKVFSAENAANALGQAEAYVKKKTSNSLDTFQISIRNLRKV